MLFGSYYIATCQLFLNIAYLWSFVPVQGNESFWRVKQTKLTLTSLFERESSDNSGLYDS